MSNETQSTRPDGRRQGQGWYLEDATQQWLWEQGYLGRVRVHLWGREVDVVAREIETLLINRTAPNGVDSPGDDAPPRIVASCMDWVTREVPPSRLWRVITMALTVRAAPVVIHNHRTSLSATAQEIAEYWRVRVVTDLDIEDGRALPEPETIAADDERFRYNPWWPAPLSDDVPAEMMETPDYELRGSPETER